MTDGYAPVDVTGKERCVTVVGRDFVVKEKTYGVVTAQNKGGSVIAYRAAIGANGGRRAVLPVDVVRGRQEGLEDDVEFVYYNKGDFPPAVKAVIDERLGRKGEGTARA